MKNLQTNISNLKMPTQSERNTANEEYFDSVFRFSKMYMWKDKCNIYIKQDDGKIKPETMKGYIDMANVVGKDWFFTRVVFPEENKLHRDLVLKFLETENAAWLKPTK